MMLFVRNMAHVKIMANFSYLYKKEFQNSMFEHDAKDT
jgi:hypothetical protein